MEPEVKATPKAISARGRDTYKQNFVASIAHLSIVGSESAPVVGARVRLSDYLPQAKWWLLYINPEDHQNAFKVHQADPGLFYDADDRVTQTTGIFKIKLGGAYDDYLQGNGVDVTTLNWEKYLEIFNKATPRINKYMIRKAKSTGSMFPRPFTIPNDTLQERTLGISLVGPETHAVSGNPLVLYLNLTPEDVSEDSELEWCTNYEPDRLKPHVDDMFTTFRLGIAHAQTRMDQLRAIARLVRSLHVMHCFSDGNGRVNVFVILPRLLMEYGFGLPLGGENFKFLDPAAIGEMFNGGYAVDEMARFLWVAQDFGLRAGSKDTILNHYHG